MSNTKIVLGDCNFDVSEFNSSAPDKGHDANLVKKGFIGVSDGSTPLVNSHRLDVRAYAENALNLLYKNKDSSSPHEMFEMALKSVPHNNIPIVSQPSCTVATLTEHNNQLSASVLGDCTVIVRLKNKQILVLNDLRLEPFDTPVANRISQLVEHGLSLNESWDMVKEDLIHNRNLANRDGTYWFFSGDKRAANEIKTLEVDVNSVEAILMYTDGFGRAIETLQIADNYESLLNQSIKKGLKRINRMIRETENRDPNCLVYPRLGISDDITAVLLTRE